MGCNKNKCNGNKTKKMQPVSKNPKTGSSPFEKGHGIHQKTTNKLKK
jgi:hypothetical protein